MTYPTLPRDDAQHRRQLVEYAIYYQTKAAFYADHAMRARDEGLKFYAADFQKLAANAARWAHNCLCELLNVRHSYDPGGWS